jgi:PAS domain-containing protein
VVIDITERRRAEMALLESERNLAEAQRIARLGNWVLEWPSRQMKWSEETFRISGLEPAREAPDFETYVQTLLPEDRPVLEKALQESVRLGKPFNLEVRHAVPGGLNYIAVKGQPVSRDGQVVRCSAPCWTSRSASARSWPSRP